MQPLGPLSLQPLHEPLAHSRRRRRLEVELGERGAQVEPGAADDDRRATRREGGIDLGVRAGGVLGDRVRGGDGDDRDEAVLEAVALGRGGRAGQDLEPGVDLQRVDGDRHRVLAARAQGIAEGEGDAGLAHAGRPEDRDDGHGGGGSMVGS